MDVRRVLDPKARFIFFTSGEFSHAFPIVHVKENLLYFCSEKGLPEQIDGGHFSAQGGTGIVQFTTPALLKLKSQAKSDQNLRLYAVDLDATDFIITNRRLSQRYEFRDFIPTSFQLFGETLTAQLINISEGGIRLRTSTPLKKNVLCHFEIKLSTHDNDLHFVTDGIVVYAEKEPRQQTFIAGISFVAPEFGNDTEKNAYLTSKEALRQFVFEKEKIT